MTISDETLMAYADGELDAAACEAVESAMRTDPHIAARVAQHRALRLRVQAAYSDELSEEVPERLLSALKGTAGGERNAADARQRVVNLRGARPAPDRDAPLARAQRRQWRMAGTLAASVILGVGVGFLIWGRAGAPFVRGAGGALVARGPLAAALSNQLAAESSTHSPVQIGISFLAKSGQYCRTFGLSGAVTEAGLACRREGEWQVQALTQTPGNPAGTAEYRTAGSATPEMILKLVQDETAGEPLDQAQERAARERNWTTMER